MKKNELTDACLFKKGIRKLLLTMKITFFLTMINILTVFATGYSQSAKLTLDLKNATLKEVFSQIEAQTSLSFLYKSDVVNPNERVSIQINEASVKDVLNSLFNNKKVQYEILDNSLIVLLPYNEVRQQQKLTGRITDSSNGEPVVGANIIIEGTTLGTVSDVDGNFSLEINRPEAVIVVSFLGYLTERIVYTGQASIEVKMIPDVKKLEEIVVIGYGSRQKKDLTGAVVQINSNEITKQVTMSPELSMQGKMAGVFVSNPGASPTARPTIRIRGVSTLGYNDPLYVVDGIPLTEGGASSTLARTQTQRGDVNVFNMINPNDIESISVLKDASATAIYGVRASNGVILITTKRGSEGKPKIDVNASYGIQNIYKRYDVASMQEYVDWSVEAYNANTALAKDQYYPFFDSTSDRYLGNSANYSKDWIKAALIENAPVQDYNINVSGGNKMSNYAIGSGYTKQQSPVYNDDFDRISFFLNSDHKLTNWLKVGESYRFAYSRFNDAANASFSDVLQIVPWQPFYDPQGPMGFAPTGRYFNNKIMPYGYGLGTRNNFEAIDKYTKAERNLLRNMGTFYAELNPVKGLRIKGTFSFDYYTNKGESYAEPSRGLFENSRGTLYTGEGNTYSLKNNENINLVKELLVGYNAKFGDHSLDIVLNATDQKVKWNLSQQSITKSSPVVSWDQRYINEGWDPANKGSFYERYPSGLQGYMGRLSYNYASKYYFDATVRRDGTSKFGPGYKWGTFPSFAAAWRITSEKFMENVTWLDDLKLRGGWGQTGNQETRDYAFLSMVNVNPKAGFGVTSATLTGDGIIYQAAALGDFPIDDMSWETVTNTTVGFDAVLLKSKFTFTAEYYNRLTDGILQTISIPQVVGALNNPVVNLAKVENSGFEFQAGYNDKIGDLGFNASANFTTVKNVVKNLYRGQPSTNGNSRIEEGYSMNFIYGYKTDGIFQTADEVTQWKSTTTDAGRESQKSPGDVKFVDLYGAPTADDPKDALKHYVPDGKIDANDQTYLGKTIPGYYYGINLGLNYKNFDLSMNFRGVGDVQRINTNGLQSIAGGGLNFFSDYRNRWTSTNPSNTIPRAIQGDPSGNNRISDRHVQDAGFFRFQNFQVGYTFDAALLKKVGISGVRCYLSGSNLFVITPYDDLDPEDITTPIVFTVGAHLSF